MVRAECCRASANRRRRFTTRTVSAVDSPAALGFRLMQAAKSRGATFASRLLESINHRKTAFPYNRGESS